MKSSVRRVFEIILWSGVTNVVLLTAFFVGLGFQEFRSSMAALRLGELQQAQPSWVITAANILGVIPASPPPPPMPMQLADRGDLQLVVADPDGLKGSLEPLPITSVEKSEDSAGFEAEATAAEEVAAEAIDGEAPLDVVGPEGAQAQSLSPVLKKNRKNGKLEIGNFDTVSLMGNATECLEMGYTLLDDAGASDTELEVLAQTSMITMARICASNGSVVITCRADQVTISPRRPRPNDTCTS